MLPIFFILVTSLINKFLELFIRDLILIDIKNAESGSIVMGTTGDSYHTWWSGSNYIKNRFHSRAMTTIQKLTHHFCFIPFFFKSKNKTTFWYSDFFYGSGSQISPIVGAGIVMTHVDLYTSGLAFNEYDLGKGFY